MQRGKRARRPSAMSHTPAKMPASADRSRDDNVAAPGQGIDDIKEELRRMALEIEPITMKRSDQQPSPVIGYRPTYRAVLAKRGYLVRNTLGSGSYSKVKRAVCCYGSFRDAAVKIIDRSKAPQDYQEKFMPRELELWPRLSHPNLIALLDCFQDSRRVYMVLEFADGGDALKYIQKSGAISETLARRWTSQIADAVRYMHDQGISHRDLKLENLLLDKEKNIKLADFGFVKELCSADDLSQTYCGSKSYAAPEILMGRPYDPKKADVWAVGVILYIFVTGKMPFDETKGTKSILEEQKTLEFRWSKSRKLSSACHQLIRRMFTWEFADRPSIYMVLADHWFCSDPPASSSPSSSSPAASPWSPNPSSTPRRPKTQNAQAMIRPELLVKSSFSDSSSASALVPPLQ